MEVVWRIGGKGRVEAEVCWEGEGWEVKVWWEGKGVGGGVEDAPKQKQPQAPRCGLRSRQWGIILYVQLFTVQLEEGAIINFTSYIPSGGRHSLTSSFLCLSVVIQ